MSRIREALGRSLVLAGLLFPSAGCESLRQAMGLRTNTDELTSLPEVDEPGVDTPLDVKTSSRPFFKNSRLSGGLSDQAREIERDLGIR